MSNRNKIKRNKLSGSKFKSGRSRLAYALPAALASTTFCASNQLLAQTNSDDMLEEVIVRGIRGSLERSMDIKRDAAGVVEAISAEDIGKFPDTNLAESLQRITGVSIDRRDGEGNRITVRGFGPQFNLVLLNGRHMPTTGVVPSKTQGSASDTARSFDMSNLAAEGVSGVEVYKSSNATLPTGGIGATVNLNTRRPFDTEGFTATVGAKALHDTTVRVGDEITPEYSAFASWSDDMFGASIAYTHQERHSGQSGVFTNNWSAQIGPWDPNAPNINSIPFMAGDFEFVDANGDPVGSEPLRSIDGTFTPDIPISAVNFINEPAAGTLTHLTDGIRYYHEDRERTRKNGQVTFQFRPMDELTFTFDYTTAEQEIFANGSELSFWFGGGTFPATDVQFDNHGQVRTSEFVWLESPTGVVRDIGITQNQEHVINELTSRGFNVEWDASDSLAFELDYHDSKSTSLPPSDDTIGTYFNIALGAQGNWAQGYDNSGDLPLLVGVWGDDNRGQPAPTFPGAVNSNPSAGVITSTGNTAGELDFGDLGSTVRQGWYARARSELEQIRLSGKWDFTDSGSIDFGVDVRTMEANQKTSNLTEVLEGNWGVGTPGDVPPTYFDELNYADLFDGYSTSLSPRSREFFDNAGLDTNPHFDGNSGSRAEVFTTGWIARDVKELGRFLSHRAGLAWAPASPDNIDRTIEEDINAFYIQGSYELDLGSMPLHAVLGVRYEDTEVTTKGFVVPDAIQWLGDNDLVTTPGSLADAIQTTGTGEYDHTLPSLSLSLGFTDDMIGRLAYSTSISRPDYGQMQEGINNVQAPVGGPTILGAPGGNASNGNAGLLPLESDNLDLSFEWYYGDASYLSVGYFQKDVQNFTGTQIEEQAVSTTLDPTNGPRAQAAIQALNDQNIAVNQQTLFQMVASMSTEGDGCTTAFGDGENASNSASCGANYSSYAYEAQNGWEDNVDIFARADDPEYVARVGFPVGDKTAELDGWEVAIQHFFGETGFGVQANYTVVNSDDIAFDITGSPLDTQFALLGLSDSANLVGIYEKLDWSVRLAYNWRDEFLYTTNSSVREPGHTEEYEQWDMNVSYNITDDLSVSFEAINLTGEDQRQFARTQRQLIQLSILDTRYALGVRYSF